MTSVASYRSVKKISALDLFQNEERPIPQGIVLSLIQQFAVSLAESTDFKMSYITDTLPAIDFENAITKQHASQVLALLRNHLTMLGAQSVLSRRLTKIVDNYVKLCSVPS